MTQPRQRSPKPMAENPDLVNAITSVCRKVDPEFEKEGGSTRHWVRDFFLPALEAAGYRIVQGDPEALLWALVCWFEASDYENPYVHRDLTAAAAYVGRHLTNEDMTARHRQAIVNTVIDSHPASSDETKGGAS